MLNSFDAHGFAVWQRASSKGHSLVWNSAELEFSLTTSSGESGPLFLKLEYLTEIEPERNEIPQHHFIFSEWNFILREHEKILLRLLLLLLLLGFLGHFVVPSLCVLAYVPWKSIQGSKPFYIYFFFKSQERTRSAILPKPTRQIWAAVAIRFTLGFNKFLSTSESFARNEQADKLCDGRMAQCICWIVFQLVALAVRLTAVVCMETKGN